MWRYEVGDCLVYADRETELDPALEETAGDVMRTVGYLLRRRLFRELTESNSSSFEGSILLRAHGARRKGSWVYSDGGRRNSVQRLIEKFDGVRSPLFLGICNKYDEEVSSRQSVIIHPRSKFNEFRLCRGKVPLRIYVPGEGYLEDDYYRLRKTIDFLEKKNKKSPAGRAVKENMQTVINIEKR